MEQATRTMTIRETAIAYQQAGLTVLPAIKAQKRPAIPSWKAYQDQSPPFEQVETWFGNPSSKHDGLCIVCGKTSGNLEVIDFDANGELFAAWFERIPPDLRDHLVVESTPSNGEHVIYRCQSPVSGNLKLAQRQDSQTQKVITLIETRGEGGLFLCDPTPGYELIQGDLCDLPVLTEPEREILLQAAWELNEYIPPVINGPPPNSRAAYDGSIRPGDAFNSEADPRDILKQHGWVHVRNGNDGNEYWRRPGKNSGWSATLKDGAFYVFTVNAHPFESRKAYSPFSVLTLLEHGGDYARAASALRAQGYGSPAPNTMPTPTIPATPPLSLVPLTVRQLMAKHPKLRKPIIHGLLREGETMNLISAPKMGKSWLATDLALAVSTGRDWLDTFPCERGNVLILDNELHCETSANRIPKVGNARGIPADAYADRVSVLNLRGALQDVFTLGSFFKSIEPGRYKVIILDAFYRFMPRDMDENDNGTMASLYNHIDRYADQLACSFVLIHHSSKGNQSGKSVTDVGAGAGSQSRATDTHMILRSHEEEDAVVLDAAVRSWPPVSPCCLRWSYPVWYSANDLDPAQLRSDKTKKRGQKKDEWTAQSFIDAFVDDTPAVRTSIIAKAVDAGMSRWAADNLLRAADNDGLLLRHGSGQRNEPYTYQRAVTHTNRGSSK